MKMIKDRHILRAEVIAIDVTLSSSLFPEFRPFVYFKTKHVEYDKTLGKRDVQNTQQRTGQSR